MCHFINDMYLNEEDKTFLNICMEYNKLTSMCHFFNDICLLEEDKTF